MKSFEKKIKAIELQKGQRMIVNGSICDIVFVDVNQNLKIGVVLNMLLSDYPIDAKILLEFDPTDDVCIINHKKS